MSHVATVAITVKDLECLEKAAQDCGLIFNWNQTTHKWYGSWMRDYAAEDAAYKHGIKPEDYGKCLHAISIPGNKSAYELGVVKNPNGDGYFLIWDFYAGGHGLQQHIGGDTDCNKLIDAYSKHVSIKKAAELGFSVQEETEEDGTINLTLYDYTE